MHTSYFSSFFFFPLFPSPKVIGNLKGSFDNYYGMLGGRVGTISVIVVFFSLHILHPYALSERLVAKIEVVCSFCPGSTKPGMFMCGHCLCMAEVACAQRGVQRVLKALSLLSPRRLCRVLTTHQICYRLNLACIVVATEIRGR